jgi:AcrR family transcriptional regulator
LLDQKLNPRQQEIVNQAIKLIAEKGIQNLTIKNLAKKMQFSEPAIYRHFKDKTEVLLAIVGLFEEKKNQSMINENFHKQSFSENLKQMFTRHTELFSKNPTYATVIFSEEIFKNDNRLSEKIKTIVNRNEQRLYMLIETAQNRKEIRADIDTSCFALMIIGALRLLVKKWIWHERSFELEKEVKMLHKTIIKTGGTDT